jgi:hypothetical protein
VQCGSLFALCVLHPEHGIRDAQEVGVAVANCRQRAGLAASQFICQSNYDALVRCAHCTLRQIGAFKKARSCEAAIAAA